MVSELGPADIFRENVPREFMRAVFRSLIANHRIASERPFQEFDGPEAANIRPFWCRALIEADLRHCAEKFPGEVVAIAHRDPSVTWWFHTLVTCGDVAFTQNAAQHPDELIRHSFFRARYASTNQTWLVGFEPEEREYRPEAGLPMYGILLHGRDLREHGRLGFAVVRFPTADLSGYHESRVDFFREFPDIAAEIVGAATTDIEEEQIDDTPNFELRDDQEEAG